MWSSAPTATGGCSSTWRPRATVARSTDTRLDRARDLRGPDPARRSTGGDGVVGLRHHPARLRQVLHVLRRAVHARARARRAPREILRQARALADAGYKEVQLLGQTVNSYRYEDVGFAELLRAVATVEGIERVRFTSPYPLDFSDDVIAAIAETPQDLQARPPAAAERVRRRARAHEARLRLRHLPRRSYAKLRAAMPNIAITTDILVGFCDETEEEHAATLRAQEELRFDSAFMFAYSEREGTTAARKMPDTVSPQLKSRRLSEVIALQQRITGEIMTAQIGRRERILIENPSAARRPPADGPHRRLPAGDRAGGPASTRASWSR